MRATVFDCPAFAGPDPFEGLSSCGSGIRRVCPFQQRSDVALVTDVAKDCNTKLWVGTLHHLDYLREAARTMERVAIEALMIEIVAGNDVRCLAGVAGFEHLKHGG